MWIIIRWFYEERPQLDEILFANGKGKPLGSFSATAAFMIRIDLAGGGYLVELIGELLLIAINAALDSLFPFLLLIYFIQQCSSLFRIDNLYRIWANISDISFWPQ